jgi:hypothetical protein
MLDPQTLSVIGAVTGIVGAVTGIAGFVLGYVSYRRSQKLKSLDLRLELNRRLAEVRTTISELPDLLHRSKQSRDSVLAALGTFRTGAHTVWTTHWKNDLAEAQDLAKELPPADERFQQATHDDLEGQLLAVHALELKSGRIRDKYLEALAADDRDRDHIQANHRTQTEHRLAQSREKDNRS